MKHLLAIALLTLSLGACTALQAEQACVLGTPVLDIGSLIPDPEVSVVAGLLAAACRGV